MNDNCSQCNFKFNETSIQHNRREKNNSAQICQQCYRINHAEERALKREQMKKKKFSSVIEEKAFLLKKIYGHVSAPLLICKFKIPHHEAVELSEKINKSA